MGRSYRVEATCPTEVGHWENATSIFRLVVPLLKSVAQLDIICVSAGGGYCKWKIDFQKECMVGLPDDALPPCSHAAVTIV